MKNYQEIREKALKDPAVKKEYDLLKPEFDAIEKIIQLRIKNKLTQKDLAAKTGTKQPAVSRLEKGLVNPTVYSLAKIAAVFKKKIEIRFI